MLLDVSGLRFAYSAGKPVLHGLGFTIRPGEIVALAGPNGSGKSTLIQLIVGLLSWRSGTIRVAGHSVPRRGAKTATMYSASNEYLPEFLTGAEYLDFLHGLYGERADAARIAELFHRYGMAGRERHLIEDYSHGMRKKVQLIGALLLSRRLTVIDETLNGIDLDAIFAFEEDLRSLADDGRGVLLCSHDFAMLARVADRILFLNDGILALDEPTSVVQEDYGSVEEMARTFVRRMQSAR